MSRLCIVTLLINFYEEYIMRNAVLDEAQAGIKIAKRNISNFRTLLYFPSLNLYNLPLWQLETWLSQSSIFTYLLRTRRRTKELPDEGERGEWKIWLKTQHSKNEDHGIWSHHFMANRWGNSETLFSWAPKSMQMVTAAMELKDACSLEENL